MSSDATGILKAVLRESSAYYLIGYEPPAHGRRAREVEVRVRRPGLTVRARSRYFAGPIPEEAAEAALAPGTRALRSLADAAQVDFEVRTLRERPDATTVVLEILTLSEPRERRLRLLGEAVALAGFAPLHDVADLGIPPTSASVRLIREWALGPGVWQARIVLEHVDTGETGSLLHTFGVPD